MDDVILTHKPRQINVAAQLMAARPTCSLGLGYKWRVRIPVADHGITLAGLLFGRRGLGLLGVLNIYDIVFAHNVPAYIATRK